MSGKIQINEQFSRALLHEAGHFIAFTALNHSVGGIAALLSSQKKTLKFCVLARQNEPEIGLAAGSAAELTLFEKPDEDAAGKDRCMRTPGEWLELIGRAADVLTPRKPQLERLHSLLKDEVERREFPDEFEPDELPDWNIGQPYCMLMTTSEILALIGKV